MAALRTKRMAAGLLPAGASQRISEQSERRQTHLLSCREEEGSQTSHDSVSSAAVCPERLKRRRGSGVTPARLVHPLFLPLGEAAVLASSQPLGCGDLGGELSGEVRRCYGRHSAVSFSPVLTGNGSFKTAQYSKRLLPLTVEFLPFVGAKPDCSEFCDDGFS